MDFWEQKISQLLTALRMSSVKSKIVFFTILATLIPSISMGWISYRNNRQILEERIRQELIRVTYSASRELGMWFKERHYDMRVFSASYEVIENLITLSSGRAGTARAGNAVARLKTYTSSVAARFKDLTELQVIDLEGNLLASSLGEDSKILIPKEWLKQAASGEDLNQKHERIWDPEKKLFQIAEPVLAADGRPIGLMAAGVRLDSLNEKLKEAAKGSSGQLFMITRDGQVLAGSRPGPPAKGLSLDGAVAGVLFGQDPDNRTPVQFAGLSGVDVVGTLEVIPGMAWGVVAELPEGQAYARILELRNATILVVVLTVLGVGAAAYLLGLTIVRPLDRLTKGATSVSGGDLNVALPVHGSGEVEYLTEVFNEMVARITRAKDALDKSNKTLREKNEELHKIAITDALTGIHNRKHLMETLTREVSRSKRRNHFLSIVMIDVDHFKKFNDTHGHLAGDVLLKSVAEILRSTVRDVDFVGRYGGEEFVVILPETDADQAKEIAERLRKNIASHRPGSGTEFEKVTASMGISTFPGSGQGPESLLKEADIAMYRAKRGGRNQVLISKSALAGRKEASS